MSHSDQNKYTALNYPGFDYAPELLLKFLNAGTIFTVLLKSGAIIHHVPQDPSDFKNWLIANNIMDLKMAWPFDSNPQ